MSMASCKYLFAVVLLAVFVGGYAQNEPEEHEEHLCKEPKEGPYRVVHNFPSPEGDDLLIPAVESRFNLTKVFKNLYTGEGVLVALIDDPNLVPETPLLVDAIFDPLACKVSGVYVFSKSTDQTSLFGIGSETRPVGFTSQAKTTSTKFLTNLGSKRFSTLAKQLI